MSRTYKHAFFTTPLKQWDKLKTTWIAQLKWHTIKRYANTTKGFKDTEVDSTLRNYVTKLKSKVQNRETYTMN